MSNDDHLAFEAARGEWVCECGVRFDPAQSVSADWLWNGSEWEHRHGVYGSGLATRAGEWTESREE